MAKIIQFPNMPKHADRVIQLEARLAELEKENDWIKGDITHLNDVLEANIHEMRGLLKDLAVLHGLESKTEVEFEPDEDLGFDFEFEPDFDLD